MEKVADLTILCKTREKSSEKVKKIERMSGKLVVHIEEFLFHREDLLVHQWVVVTF